MKILVVTPYYKPSWTYGGPPRCIAELAEAMVRYHQLPIQVVTLNANGRHPLFDTGETVVKTEEGVNVHYLPRTDSLWGKAYFHSPDLKNYLENFGDVDLVHVNTMFNAFSRCGMEFAVRKKIPFVMTFHGMMDHYSLSVSRWIKSIHRTVFDNRLLPKAAAIHYTSAFEKKNSVVRAAIPDEIIPIGIEFKEGTLPPAVHKSTKDEAGLRLVFLGRLHPIKGLDVLIHALHIARKHYGIPVHLDVFGSDDAGYRAKLERIVLSHELEKYVSFKGALSPAERDEKLAEYDCMALTSYHENFGLAAAEALAQGIPVLVSDQVSLADFISSNKCGWVAASDADAIARKLEEIYQTPAAQKRQMGERGFDAVRREFDLRKIAARFFQFYTAHRRK